MKRKRIRLVVAAIAALPVVLFFATARYGSYTILGVRYISRPPFASVSWGPARAYMVTEGVNALRDNGVGRPGNILEFPLGASQRVSLRVFSVRWLRQEFNGWASNHRKIARWLGYRNDCDKCPGARAL